MSLKYALNAMAEALALVQAARPVSDWQIVAAARSPKKTLATLGLPTTWYHGTVTQFDKLKPKGSVNGIWLGDLETAEEYGRKRYADPSRHSVIEVKLDPSTRVVDLEDVNDPFVEQMLAYIDQRSAYGLFGRGPSKDEWQGQSSDFGSVEYHRLDKFFKAKKVDALYVRDVQGWGGHAKTRSLLLLNLKKIVNETRKPLRQRTTSARSRNARLLQTTPR